MNGSDAQSRGASAASPRRSWTGRLWMLGTAAAVIAVCAAIRLAGVPRAVAQAPATRSANPALQTQPGTIRVGSPSSGAASAPLPATIAVPSGAAARTAASANSATQGQPADPRRGDNAAKPTSPPASTLQVMAVVNNEQITRTELGRECIRRYGEEVLESMVNRQLIGAACAQQGIQISDADVSAEIDRIAARFGLSRDRWLNLLRDERGFSEEQYRREVVWPMLALRQLAAGQTEVTQDDLKKAFESEFGPKVRARLIAVDSKAKADQIRAQAVASPNEFGELSKQHTVDGGVASAYGVIPPIRKHLGDAHLEQVAFSLKPGQISEVVNVANMYYILKCEEILPQQFLSGQQLAEQQARLKEKLKENKLRVAASEFFEKMQKQAKIVNVLNDREKQQQMPGVAATVNGQPITLAQLSEECILRHGSDVLDGEINRKILQQELNRKRQPVGEQDIDAEVARAAEAYGSVKKDGTPDVEKWLKSITEQPGATVDLYVRDAVWPSVALKKLVGGKVAVTEEDLKKGYESNYGERVEVLAIVLSDQRQAQKVWDMARNNPTDAFFAELAHQYSLEPASRANGGKVPPIRRYGGSPIVEEAAFKLKQGELSGLIAVDNQYIILRCQGRTRPVQVDFNAAKGELTKDIEEKKLRLLMTKEFDRLREVAQVDNFLAGTSQSGKTLGSTRPSSPATISAGAAPASGALATPRPNSGGALSPSGTMTLPRSASGGPPPATATLPARPLGPQSR